jgi:hypothetical protein
VLLYLRLVKMAELADLIPLSEMVVNLSMKTMKTDPKLPKGYYVLTDHASNDKKCRGLNNKAIS